MFLFEFLFLWIVGTAMLFGLGKLHEGTNEDGDETW